jgi:hypothetical protein
VLNGELIKQSGEKSAGEAEGSTANGDQQGDKRNLQVQETLIGENAQALITWEIGAGSQSTLPVGAGFSVTQVQLTTQGTNAADWAGGVNLKFSTAAADTAVCRTNSVDPRLIPATSKWAIGSKGDIYSTKRYVRIEDNYNRKR